LSALGQPRFDDWRVDVVGCFNDVVDGDGCFGSQRIDPLFDGTRWSALVISAGKPLTSAISW